MLVTRIAEKTQVCSSGRIEGSQGFNLQGSIAMQLSTQCFNDGAKTQCHLCRLYLPVDAPLAAAAFSALITLSVMSSLGLI